MKQVQVKRFERQASQKNGFHLLANENNGTTQRFSIILSIESEIKKQMRHVESLFGGQN